MLLNEFFKDVDCVNRAQEDIVRNKIPYYVCILNDYAPELRKFYEFQCLKVKRLTRTRLTDNTYHYFIYLEDDTQISSAEEDVAIGEEAYLSTWLTKNYLIDVATNRGIDRICNFLDIDGYSRKAKGSEYWFHSCEGNRFYLGGANIIMERGKWSQYEFQKDLNIESMIPPKPPTIPDCVIESGQYLADKYVAVVPPDPGDTGTGLNFNDNTRLSIPPEYYFGCDPYKQSEDPRANFKRGDPDFGVGFKNSREGLIIRSIPHKYRGAFKLKAAFNSKLCLNLATYNPLNKGVLTIEKTKLISISTKI